MIYPPEFRHPAAKAQTAQYAAACIAGLAPGRGAVVQAGGCSGLWPLALSQYFARVYTFEPEPVNFACLRANVAAAPNVSAFAGALGAASGYVGMTRPKAGAGVWRVEGDGEIPMVALDGFLSDVPVDALVLDVEGSEVPALVGARRLIAAYRPLVWLECLQHTAAIAGFLAAHGYTQPQRGIAGDYYSIHASRMH